MSLRPHEGVQGKDVLLQYGVGCWVGPTAGLDVGWAPQLVWTWGGPHSWSGRLGEDKKLFPIQVIEPGAVLSVA